MLSTAKSANVGFRLVTQLFAPPTNRAMHLAQKMTFINSEKKLLWVLICAQILGFTGVRLGLKLLLGLRFRLGLGLALGSV